MARAMLVPRRGRSWLASGLKGVKGVKGWEEGVELSGLGYLALVPLLVCPHGRCCCATISSHYYLLLVYYRNTTSITKVPLTGLLPFGNYTRQKC